MSRVCGISASPETSRDSPRLLEDAGGAVRRPLSSPATLALKTFKLLPIESIASVKTYYMICLLMKYAQLTYYQIIYITLARINTIMMTLWRRQWRPFGDADRTGAIFISVVLVVLATNVSREA